MYPLEGRFVNYKNTHTKKNQRGVYGLYHPITILGKSGCPGPRTCLLILSLHFFPQKPQ